MLRRGVASLDATLRGGAALLGATLRWGVASLYATLRGAAASLGTMLRGGVASLGTALSLERRGKIPSVLRDGGTVPSSGVALCKCLMPLLSYDKGAVPSSSWGALLPYGSTRVLAVHSCRAKVAVEVGIAIGAGAGMANSVSRGSSCGIESSLALLAEL